MASAPRDCSLSKLPPALSLHLDSVSVTRLQFTCPSRHVKGLHAAHILDDTCPFCGTLALHHRTALLHTQPKRHTRHTHSTPDIPPSSTSYSNLRILRHLPSSLLPSRTRVRGTLPSAVADSRDRQETSSPPWHQHGSNSLISKTSSRQQQLDLFPDSRLLPGLSKRRAWLLDVHRQRLETTEVSLGASLGTRRARLLLCAW